MYICLHVKHPLFWSDVNETNFLNRVFKNNHLSNFMKILLVGAQLFHAGGRADRQTDKHHETRSLFPQFWAKA